jgi:hypothetical protein
MGKWTKDDDWDSGSWPPQPGTAASKHIAAAAIVIRVAVIV